MPQPQPPQPLLHSRINLSVLKSQIAKRVGPERAHRYFECLNKLLSNKACKPEFSKICIKILGRENVPLHNQLICSIIQNAYNAKVPPPPLPSRNNRATMRDRVDKANACKPSLVLASPLPIWSNGDILPPYPQNCRSGIQNQRIKDRPSPLGPNGRAEVDAHQSLIEVGLWENEEFIPCDLKRLVQHHHHGPAEQPEKRPRIERSSLHNHGSVVVLEDVDDVQRRHDCSSIRGPLCAPLGISFCPASVGGAWRSITLTSGTSTSSSIVSSYASGELCHTRALRQRMEKVAELQGLGGVTIDCANLLNNGLDAYIKRLLKSCVELVGARSGNQLTKQTVQKQQPQGKPINGVWHGNHINVHNPGVHLEGQQEKRYQCPISVQDFKVAMELNPQRLGEDCPLLEKIWLYPFEE